MFSILLAIISVHDLPVPASPPRIADVQCGPASLFALLRLETPKCELTFDDVTRACGAIPVEGMSLHDLEQVGERVGLRLVAIRSKPQALNQSLTPFIAHMGLGGGVGHFVVVLSIDEKTVRTLDGTTHQVSSDARSNFDRFWTGYAVGPNDRFKRAWPDAVGIILGLVAVMSTVLVGRMRLPRT